MDTFTWVLSCRSGIAYISNVAVRKQARRKGIARSLIREAEKAAASWGCRSIALHCDRNNLAALGLYSRAGYKVVKAPGNAKWPQPKSVSGSELCLMMKCLVFG
jgi:ribosomal protein S18 acetylase RimI-like enzyme